MFQVVSQAWHRLAAPWRPIVAPENEDFFRRYDAVIAQDEGVGRRGNTYEVWTYGSPIATRHNLADAKAAVEEVYGPLQWERVTLDPLEVTHYYFGPSTEWSDPLTIYVVDHLPRL